MEIETLKNEINTEVQKRAEELAKDEIRNLTLAKKRTENLVKTAQAEILELDKKIAEVKIEDFEENALASITDKLTEPTIGHIEFTRMLGSLRPMRRF